MPHIINYHPSIPIKLKTNEIVLLKLDLPDWEPEEEILLTISKALNVTTIQELVEAIQKPNSKHHLQNTNIQNCTIDPNPTQTPRKQPLEWNQKLKN